MTQQTPTLPNLIIIGAMKAGTSSLHYYLSKHPQIFMSEKKELNFFNHDMRRGLEWYKSNFDARYPVNGESTPQYARFPKMPGIPERIKEVVGTPKIIYMVRDPVDRIVSHYVHSISREWEDRPFEEVLSNIDVGSNDYVLLSSYFFQLSQYLRMFPRERIKVVLLERLSRAPRDTLKEVFRFLEVDEDFWSPEFDRRLNAGEARHAQAPWFSQWAPEFIKGQAHAATWMPWKMARALRKLSRVGAKPLSRPKIPADADLNLQKLLKPDVEALKEYLGNSLGEWRPYA